MFSLLTNLRKFWIFLRISFGKVVRMKWQAKDLPPPLNQGAGRWPAILSLQLSLKKSLQKPIPSLHWLIGIFQNLVKIRNSNSNRMRKIFPQNSYNT